MSDVDDKLKVEALHWLTGLRETAEKAQGFAMDQAPDVIRELVTLGRVEETAGFLGIVALLIFSAIAVNGMRKIDFSKEPEPGVVMTLVFGVLGIAGLTICTLETFGNIHDLACVWFAPRIYVMETLADLAGKAVGK